MLPPMGTRRETFRLYTFVERIQRQKLARFIAEYGIRMQYLSLSWLALDGFVCIPDFALSVMFGEIRCRERYKFLIISIGSSAICKLSRQSRLIRGRVEGIRKLHRARETRGLPALGEPTRFGSWLRQEGIKDRRLAHGMIGKFVYIHYLRQRKILSDNRLEEWGIDPGCIFGHSARLNSFLDLVQHVDDWLNGSVFPLSQAKIREFGAERIRKVASVFQGEEAVSGQLPLFDVYDFSFIPVETLSVIYEHFLHDTVHPSGESEGETRSAYYTPVPLVNFMLDKLDSKKQLEQGMRVLDPSCGSGAFLVQCYRKLIERRRQELGRRLRPAELGRLLTNHIFGIDVDEDACQIAELSLALTLLEYVNPPDLTETEFKLPVLRGSNIFSSNTFDNNAPWYQNARKRPFQWIVGNPPWKDLKPKELDETDQLAWQWMETNRKECPVGGNSLLKPSLGELQSSLTQQAVLRSFCRQ